SLACGGPCGPSPRIVHVGVEAPMGTEPASWLGLRCALSLGSRGSSVGPMAGLESFRKGANAVHQVQVAFVAQLLDKSARSPFQAFLPRGQSRLEDGWCVFEQVVGADVLLARGVECPVDL